MLKEENDLIEGEINDLNEVNEVNNEYNCIKLDSKFNLKFYLLCQLFESLSKAKAKSKVK